MKTLILLVLTGMLLHAQRAQENEWNTKAQQHMAPTVKLNKDEAAERSARARMVNEAKILNEFEKALADANEAWSAYIKIRDENTSKTRSNIAERDAFEHMIATVEKLKTMPGRPQ